MAANSLFSCFRGKKFSYTVNGKNPVDRILTVNTVNINRMDKPPAKKRRMENEDEWDDDDFELTQKDLESIATVEIMASQSNMSRYPTDPGPSGAARSTAPRSGSVPQYSFVKPRTANSSSSSSGSSLIPQSTPGSRNSTSSTSSEEIPFAAPSRRNSSSHSEINDQSLTTAYLRNPIVEAEIEKWKQKCQVLQTQLNTAKEDSLSNEGRLKILQNNLTKKESELSEIRQERAKHIEQQKREQTEKERSLQSEVDKLTTQIQFKDREIDNFKDRCRTLESQCSASTSNRSPVRSPVVKKPRYGDKSPKGRSSFPTSQSFMAEHSTSQSGAPGQRTVTTNDCGVMTVEVGNQVQKERRFAVTSRCPRGQISSVELLADLLDADLSSEKSGDGVIGLLQKKSSVIDLQNLQFDRDSSNLLSPVNNKRLQDMKRKHSLLQSPEKSAKKPIVSPDSYSSAIHGMKCLLCNQKTFQSRTETSPILTDTSLNGAILFLPMIDDYLTQYLDILNSNIEGHPLQSPRHSFTSSSSSKSSYDSSIESLTASLDLLLKDSANFANNLESLALVALQVLHKLVSYSAVVRNILLNVDEDVLDERSIAGEGGRQMETDKSSPSSSLDSDLSISSQRIVDMHILGKVLKIADCGNKGKWYNTSVVQKSFEILIVLGKNAPDVQVNCLRPEVTGRLLVNALDCRTDRQIVVCGLSLLSTLVQYNQIVSGLCVCTEGCILLTMYQCCTDLINSDSEDKILVIGDLVLNILSTIQDCHKGGIVLLLESGCTCSSMKVIPSIVVLGYKLLQMYERSGMNTVLEVLLKSWHLLHIIAQRQYDFTEKHYSVELQYVKFVCGVTKLLKELPENFEHELMALDYLWDFNQDDSELSPDNDSQELSLDSEEESQTSDST